MSDGDRMYDKEIFDKALKGEINVGQLDHATKEKLLNGQPINIASRGMGVVNDDGIITNFQPISYDIVAVPACKAAVLQKPVWYMRWFNKIKYYYAESKSFVMRLFQ